MSTNSKIEWTDATWNPVTGCTKVSPGCKYCYALTFAERFRGTPGHPFEQGFDLRLWPQRLGLPLAWKTPKRIFVNSMSDLFHERIPFPFIDRVFLTMARATWHEFQVLTKRPARMAEYVHLRRGWFDSMREQLPHIWLGASVENQKYVERAEIVASLPSAVRFLSCEPLLGPLNLRHVLGGDRVNWVIAGGESGHHARPMDPAWVASIRDQCLGAGVPFFFKQWGGRTPKAGGRTLDDRTWDQWPARNIATLSDTLSPTPAA